MLDTYLNFPRVSVITVMPVLRVVVSDTFCSTVIFSIRNNPSVNTTLYVGESAFPYHDMIHSYCAQSCLAGEVIRYMDLA